MNSRHCWNLRENLRWITVLLLIILCYIFPNGLMGMLLLTWVSIQILLGNIKRISRRRKSLYFVRMTLYFLPYAVPFFMNEKAYSTESSCRLALSFGLAIGIYALWFFSNYSSIKIMVSKEMIADSNYMDKHIILFLFYSQIGAAVCEELFFRGFILSIDAPMFLLLPASVYLFWLSHWGLEWGDRFSLRNSIEQISIGLFNGLLFCLSGSVLPCVLVHLLINITSNLDLVLKYDRWFFHKDKYDKILPNDSFIDELEL